MRAHGDAITIVFSPLRNAAHAALSVVFFN
jgi:hypothetical protein